LKFFLFTAEHLNFTNSDSCKLKSYELLLHDVEVELKLLLCAFKEYI